MTSPRAHVRQCRRRLDALCMVVAGKKAVGEVWMDGDDPTELYTAALALGNALRLERQTDTTAARNAARKAGRGL